MGVEPTTISLATRGSTSELRPRAGFTLTRALRSTLRLCRHALRSCFADKLEEAVGFEPTVPVKVRLISSQVL